MISRLLLVGLVGVLGISVPDGADWGTVLTCARSGTPACSRVREAVAFEPIAVAEDAANLAVDELNRRSEGLDLAAMPVVRVAKVGRPTPAGPARAIEDLFAENRVWGEPTAADVAIRRPSFEPIAVIDDPTSLADALNRASEGLDIDPPAVGVAHRLRFEPIAVAEAGSLADELNRASEGLSVARDPEPSIGTALRLTHEAALAWMNVLTKTVTPASSH